MNPLATLDDPILALATAPGRGAIGIVRISSPQPLEGLIHALFGQALQPRHAHYLPFRDAAGQLLDQGLALHFPAPHSATGEHVLELQAHGGPVLLDLLLARCLETAAPAEGPAALPRLRLADPGEFTRRAWLNGKLDLTQAEAVADLIDASTEAAARSASRALAGAFSQGIAALRERLIELRALVEATLDFPEEDLDFLEQARARPRLAALEEALAALRARARQGVLLRDGLRVVLAGQPNVGKSSLLNALAGAERAIVTPIPGTTRDSISESLQIGGLPLHITDTAGLRRDEDTADEVERLGIARSWAAIAEADAVIFLRDLGRRGQPEYDAADARIAAGLAEAGAHTVLAVWNKADLLDTPPPEGALSLSTRSGAGLEALRQRLLQAAGAQPAGEGSFIARARHLDALAATAGHLAAARALLDAPGAPLELLAEELRAAHDALGAITGHTTADELLGEIFGRFCIGK
ncbi:tRNA uridine-5-carboxymethylaminomethyl(34) synthesis GTPase MnmE [Piscinibacter sp. Jin2]|uniref:tRNA modification GTPase MnmE n=1 Tax=Aquariibacter lacus TaxID=2801332 RepID=A0A9X0XCT2_9BURK|nr:tRNA uridine-5-carboxymethylaminomethyl(34) synthesis GTPase MnmE [Piscinibacter lacus]MBL0718583.1 tRNA uridine-5-carboxymethylaminomethyl(34) synthesis GTPase MnmE [Piscinibacter lacus]